MIFFASNSNRKIFIARTAPSAFTFIQMLLIFTTTFYLFSNLKRRENEDANRSQSHDIDIQTSVRVKHKTAFEYWQTFQEVLTTDSKHRVGEDSVANLLQEIIYRMNL